MFLGLFFTIFSGITKILFRVFIWVLRTSLKVPNFLRSQDLSHSATRDAARAFHLWWQ